MKKNAHTPTSAMKAAAKRGIQMANEGADHDELALAAAKKMVSGQKLTDEHVHTMAAHHTSHATVGCPGDCNDLLWGGAPGAMWSVARSAALSASSPDDGPKLSELLEDEETLISFEIFSEDNLGEPTSLGEDENGLIWSPILRSGMTLTRPGLNGEKIPDPLVFVPGHSDDQRKEIGLQDIVDAFADNAVQHVTIPTNHDNNLLDNTGFIKAVKIVDSKKNPGEKVLIGAHNFTEPDIKGRVKRGTIANRSCGLLYDYTNPTTGKTYPIVLEHVALTNSPWVHGMPSYGELSEAELGDRKLEVVPMLLGERLSAPAPKPEEAPTIEGLRPGSKKDAPSTKLSEEELRKQLGLDLADVQWGDEPSLNSIRGQITAALGKLRKMGGDDNVSGPPYYYVMDVTAEKALISVEYGGSDPDDAWVASFTTDSDGTVTLAPYTDWIPVEQQWVTDDDAEQDKQELEAIINAAETAQELEGNLKLSEADLALAALTSKAREKLPDDAFVFPKDKRYPIQDLAHARNALARSSGKPEEAAVKKAVYKKYPQLDPSKKKTQMSELPDDPLKRASARRLAEATPQPTSNTGGIVRLSEEQMETLGLSDEAKELIRKQNAEIDRQAAELAESKKQGREERVKARITELSQGPLKAFPGFLREVEAAMLADDGDVAIKINLADGQGGSVPTPMTATQLAERFIVALSAQAQQQHDAPKAGSLLESPLQQRPDLEPEKPGESDKPKTADEMLAEWRAADPNALAALASPDNRDAGKVTA